MGLISFIKNKLSPAPSIAAAAQNAVKRSTGYFAAEYSRINASLVSEARHINEIIRWQGYALLSRSRQMADNNPYAAKFLQMAVSNICGPVPFQMQGRVSTRSGKPDDLANKTIEAAWQRSGRPENIDFHGRLSRADIYRLAIRTLARDGECLIRRHEGAKAGPYGYQLQMIDTDRLDFNLNQQLPEGNIIHAGVEVDPQGRTVAYHIRKRRPADWQMGACYRGEYERIQAEQMFHLFLPLSAEQVRGVPWIYAVLINLHQLGAFEEAAIIAARVGAAKMGFFERDPNFPDAEYQGEKDSSGAKVTDAEPGTFEEIPMGLKLSSWDPNYPSDQVGPFLKSCLRGISSGWGVAYHTLAGDLEAVNFSSARAGVLEEREMWMLLQNWFVEHFCQYDYENWLAMASLAGKLPLNGSLEKYSAVYFQPRRWQWVDPLKDVQANVEAIQWGLKSRTSVVAEQGLDIEDVMDQLKAENDLAKTKKVQIAPEKAPAQPPAKPGEPADGGANEQDN